MSNFLAVATVTASLQRLLQAALDVDVPGALVTTERPQDPNNGGGRPGVNLYLYQITPNIAGRNADLPTRAPDGRLAQRPQAALDLHYLLTFYGDDGQLEPERLLGSVVRTLHTQPTLTRELIEETIADPDFSFLAGSNLADAVERVRIMPMPFSLEELSKLWSVFFQIPYALSIAYQASVVFIEAAETPAAVLPVQERIFFLTPSTQRAPLTTPDQIADLQLWLRSDEGLTYDSQGVAEWVDQSGNGFDAVQSDPDRRPALVAHGVGHRPVLRFDGVDDYLAIRNLSYSAAGALDGLTVCALVRSSSDQQQIIASFDRDQYWRLALQDTTVSRVGWDTAAAAGTHNLRPPDRYTDGRWHWVCGWFQAGAAPDKRLLIDGEQMASASAHGGSALGTGTTRFGFIGVGSEAAAFDGARGPAWFLQGDLAELLIYHRALSDAELAALERYLVDRYSG